MPSAPATAAAAQPAGWSVRPIRAADAAAFAALHGRADAGAIGALIAESQQAFDADGPGPLRRVFVLVGCGEAGFGGAHDGADCGGSGATDFARPAGDRPRDGAAGQAPERLLGAIALTGSTGLDLPRHAFRRGVVVHASAELKLFHRAGTLLLGNDLTGCAELGLPRVAGDGALAARQQRLLIDAALLFVAERPDSCAGTVIATLPGIRYRGGGSPFWRGLGRHFHSGVPPDDDAFFGAPARSHIGRLLPKHPLYTSFLGADAQACIGQRALHARAVDDALRAQGFRSHGHVDIFDGGPVLMSETADLAALRRSRRLALRVEEGDHRGDCLLLVPGRGPDAGVALSARGSVAAGAVTVSTETAVVCRLDAGRAVRVLVCDGQPAGDRR